MGLEGGTEPVSVAPGATASTELVVSNTGAEPVAVEMDVVGGPASWSWVAPPTASVPAGGQARARITFRCPPGSDPAAGDQPYEVRLRSSADRRELARVPGTVSVTAVADLAATLVRLEPNTPDDADFMVDLRNRGNVVSTVSLAGSGGEGLAVRVEPATMEVGPGATGRADVFVDGSGEVAEDTQHTVRVEVLPDPGEASVVEGTFTQLARLRRRWPKLVVAGVALAVALAFVVPRLGGGDSGSDAPTATTTADALAFDPDCPGRGHEAAEANGFSRGGPVPVAYSFLFLADDGCTPVRFDPCQPIPYVTDERLATPEDLADLRRALRMVTDVTGIEFVHEGPTDETGTGRRGFYDERYGDRWSPVLVSWVDTETMGAIVARAVDGGADVEPSAYPGAGASVLVDGSYVTGSLILNTDALDPGTGERIDNGFGAGLNWGRVMAHEIGHLVGLGHIRSTDNLMQHELVIHTIPSDQWGAGDLVGLRALGTQAGCAPGPEFDPDIHRLQRGGRSGPAPSVPPLFPEPVRPQG